MISNSDEYFIYALLSISYLYLIAFGDSYFFCLIQIKNA